MVVSGRANQCRDTSWIIGSNNGERRYLDFLRVVLSQRPAKQLTHWTHLLVCLGDGSLHIALGTYGSSIRPQQIFAFPAALVSVYLLS